MYGDANTHAHLQQLASKIFNTQATAAADQFQARVDYACATVCRCMHVGAAVFGVWYIQDWEHRIYKSTLSLQ